MNRENLEKVAESVFDEEGQFEVDEMLREGQLERVELFLLRAIDHCYDGGVITRDEATEYYKLLDLSPERVCAFRQENYS